jgi:hypothetical protein
LLKEILYVVIDDDDGKCHKMICNGHEVIIFVRRSQELPASDLSYFQNISAIPE